MAVANALTFAHPTGLTFCILIGFDLSKYFTNSLLQISLKFIIFLQYNKKIPMLCGKGNKTF